LFFIFRVNFDFRIESFQTEEKKAKDLGLRQTPPYLRSARKIVHSDLLRPQRRTSKRFSQIKKRFLAAAYQYPQPTKLHGRLSLSLYVHHIWMSGSIVSIPGRAKGKKIKGANGSSISLQPPPSSRAARVAVVWMLHLSDWE
jgi:hypothetical protein